MAWSAHKRMQKNSPLYGKTSSDLVYPKHPFPADLCLKLTSFPAGFRELALSKKLSIQSIDFVDLVLIAARDSGEVSSALSSTSDELLGKPGLTTLERLVAIALGAYNARQSSRPIPVFLVYLQEQVKILASKSDIYTCDPDVLDWACLILRASTERNTGSWRWADSKLQGNDLSELRRKQLEEAFLPIPQRRMIFSTREV